MPMFSVMPRIFVCDDAPDYRRLLREVFADEGDLEVVGEACDGRQCVAALVEADADVVLLDLNMPVLSGQQILPRLRRLAPKTQVVVLSSAEPQDAEDEVLELGATAFIQKPMNVFDLAGIMREKVPALDRRRTPRAA